MASLREQVLRRKPVTAMTAETGDGQRTRASSKRTIGLFQLTLFGVGATIGTGIFIVLTVRRSRSAGPRSSCPSSSPGSVAGLTAICYAELASAVPVSGSSYSYAYATLGEGVAMVVAACLLLEYGVSAAAVAVGWSQYLNELFDNLFGFTIPESLSQAPEQGGVLNVPGRDPDRAVHAAAASAARASRRRSTRSMVLIKLGVLVLFVVVGLHGLGLRQPRRTSPRSASTGSPRRRASSSSPTSASTPSRPPARR